jgi:hypothetical protein
VSGEDDSELSDSQDSARMKEIKKRSKFRKAFRHIDTQNIDDFINRKVSKTKIGVSRVQHSKIKESKAKLLIF